MTRRGKIARLSVETRYELNSRLQNGELAKTILEWLNAEEDTKSKMKEMFEDAPVTEQNLSEWRNGGYQEWLRHQEACEAVTDLEDEALEMHLAGDEQDLSEILASKLTWELTNVSLALMKQTEDPKERWRLLQEILPQLARMRLADHRAAHLDIKKEGWDWKRIERRAAEIRNERYRKEYEALIAPAKTEPPPAASIKIPRKPRGSKSKLIQVNPT